jgi:hypothetical protein
MNIKTPTDSNRRVSALIAESSGADWGLGPAVHRLAQGMRRLPNRAEMNSAIVRRRTRVVPLGTVNGKLNGGVRMPRSSDRALRHYPLGLLGLQLRLLLEVLLQPSFVERVLPLRDPTGPVPRDTSRKSISA